MSADAPWTFRQARPDDHAAIVAVLDEWWGRPMTGMVPRLFLEHFHDTSTVAELDDGSMAGFLVGFLSPAQPQAAYIHFVGVRPDTRGQGLARNLYERFFELARSAGRTEVQCITGPSNTGSIAFHTALGFEVAGPIEQYEAPGEPRMTFRRTL